MTTALLLLDILTSMTPSGDPVAAVEAWLKRSVPDAVGGSQTQAIVDERLTRVMPRDRFVSLRFREFPIAQTPVQPLNQRNVFVVDAQDRAKHLENRTALVADFLRRAPRVEGRQGAVDLAAAYLAVSKEFSQDGFFRFQKPGQPKVTTRSGALIVELGLGVEPNGGDRGSLDGVFTFGRDGAQFRLTKIEEKDSIQPGVRPVCQSTLLLDPNPVVRRMAERDLLVMGERALPYLRERRATASPLLQREIDRVIGRIERGER